MSGGARKGSPASSALSLLLLVAPLLAPAALASVPRGAAALPPLSPAADVDALDAPRLETSLARKAGSPFALDDVSLLRRSREGGFRVFAGDELGDAHALVFALSYPETRVRGLGLPDETRVGVESTLRLEAPWACDERSSGEATGSGEFRIFDPAGTSRSTSAFGWNRLFQGREYIGVVDAYDFRARTLWPELGRFAQEDPAGVEDSPNRYQALKGSWLAYADPSGMRSGPLPPGFPSGPFSSLRGPRRDPAIVVSISLLFSNVDGGSREKPRRPIRAIAERSISYAQAFCWNQARVELDVHRFEAKVRFEEVRIGGRQKLWQSGEVFAGRWTRLSDFYQSDRGLPMVVTGDLDITGWTDPKKATVIGTDIDEGTFNDELSHHFGNVSGEEGRNSHNVLADVWLDFEEARHEMGFSIRESWRATLREHAALIACKQGNPGCVSGNDRR